MSNRVLLAILFSVALAACATHVAGHWQDWCKIQTLNGQHIVRKVCLDRWWI